MSRKNYTMNNINHIVIDTEWLEGIITEQNADELEYVCGLFGMEKISIETEEEEY